MGEGVGGAPGSCRVPARSVAPVAAPGAALVALRLPFKASRLGWSRVNSGR